MDYAEFIDRKTQLGSMDGFDPIWMPDFLFGFQEHLVDWALRKGRGGLFEDCGLGKSPQELVWCENIVRKTNKPVLLICPIAVGAQMLREAEKFGIEAHRSRDGTVYPGINITNYEKLHLFNPHDFGGVALDESSIIKSFDGHYKAEITEFMRKLPYRSLWTATAAPNDYIELGTSSEALGELGYMDMLSRFFKNDQNNTIKALVVHHRGQNFAQLDDAAKWRLKGHAEVPFWRWVCSWARACRKPSDLGFDDGAFTLPELIERDYLVEASTNAPGMLFALPAVGLKEQRAERRRTIKERCAKVAELVASKVNEPSLVWCHLNDEGDLLAEMIPEAVQVKGADSEDWKEMAAQWFSGNKCICNEPLFRAKLSAWTKKNTCAYGSRKTESASRNTDKQQPTSATLGGENSTQPTQKHEGGKSRKRQATESATLTQDSSASLSDTASHSTNTSNCSPKDAQSAEEKQTSISGDSSDSTSIIATVPDNSEDYCARLAISVLENSGMTQLGLSGPQCICGHQSGKRVLISKPVMFGYGLNFPACAHQTFFPSHSFEQYYQGVRRSWRFGQTRPVRIDIVTTEGEKSVLKNLQRKADQADKMFSKLVEHMRDAEKVQRSVPFTKKQELPKWL